MRTGPRGLCTVISRSGPAQPMACQPLEHRIDGALERHQHQALGRHVARGLPRAGRSEVDQFEDPAVVVGIAQEDRPERGRRHIEQGRPVPLEFPVHHELEAHAVTPVVEGAIHVADADHGVVNPHGQWAWGSMPCLVPLNAAYPRRTPMLPSSRPSNWRRLGVSAPCTGSGRSAAQLYWVRMKEAT